MDTKWKKWKNRIGCLLFLVGLSSLLLCAAMTVQHMIRSKAMYGNVQFGIHDDYQDSVLFRESIADELDTALQIAAGTFLDWNYIDEHYRYENSSTSTASDEVTESVAYEMSPEGYNAYQNEEYYDNGYDYYDREYSKEETDKMIEHYLKDQKNDRNLLYQIVKNGETLYSNMEFDYHYGDVLPEGYNYLMFFDGKKVSVEKNGKKEEIYGDGIFEGNNQYSVPGYSNYIADENLENVTVALIAIKTPLQYRVVGRDDGTYYYGSSYSIYQDMINMNHDFQKIITSGMIGIICLLLSILLYRRTDDSPKNLANLLHKIWIEPKILILLLLACGFIHNIYSWDGGYYTREVLQTIVSSDYDPGMTYEIVQDCPRMLFDNPLQLLILFWVLYLLIYDIIHNHNKPIQGFIPMLFRGFNDKTLKMDYSRRQVRRMSVLVICIMIVFLLFILSTYLFAIPRYYRGNMMIVFSVFALILLVFIFLIYYRLIHSQANDLELLDHQIELISSGHYEPQKVTFAGKDFVKTEENLLQIQNGIKTAVDEQLSSERMKVDLVANVSHDLKTPLTSIISYVQFLKDETELPDHVKDYIRILDEKSQRLNEMVQDVFSISKATSGQLPINIEILDFGKLLNQTLADMEKTISHSSILIKSDIREHEFFISADGQKMYRVCQNLIQNALKYSLEGSRMFITLEQRQNQAVATFKNTSKAELNQSTDFSERFVRGDRSRTDGGSGLGLSIAKSFTEACGGTFTLEINGDMFIVTIAFIRKSEQIID